ncbi:MAG TPA: hypothetical protein VLG44_02100 [Chlamydiales bacterium]|nr:hypothetical protein [Chlamydiales bacterium]
MGIVVNGVVVGGFRGPNAEELAELFPNSRIEANPNGGFTIYHPTVKESGTYSPAVTALALVAGAFALYFVARTTYRAVNFFASSFKQCFKKPNRSLHHTTERTQAAQVAADRLPATAKKRA